MNRKPDIIRAIVLIFTVGLIITGFTSMQAPENGLSPAVNAYVSNAPPASNTRETLQP